MGFDSMPKGVSPEEERSVLEFVMKLAEDEELPDEEIIEGIVANLRRIQASSSLPDILDRLDPGRFHPETKVLTDTQKARLNTALDQFLA